MKLFSIKRLSITQRYRIKQIMAIAIFWTAIDLVTVILKTEQRLYSEMRSIRLREAFVFLMSIVMGYLLIVKLKRAFRKFPLIINFLLRSTVLLFAAFSMNLIIHISHSLIIRSVDIHQAWQFYKVDNYHSLVWLNKMVYWMILFLVNPIDHRSK